PRLTVQAHLQMVVDLVTLTVMINASGGITSSLNSLLITAVAASSILLPLSSALLAAALGFMLLTASWLLDQWHTVQVLARAERGPADWPNLWNRLNDANDDLVRLGVLGAALFIAAGLTYALAERARRGEALACQRTLELLEAAELSQGIIRHLQNGVVLVNPTGQVQLLNETAQEWLDCPQTVPGLPLEALSPPLARRLRDWLDDNLEHPAFRPAEHRPELIPRFTRLSGRQATSVLILLEDSQQATERLQQLKLAALGRLTAGIAHEIRNPLAAIGHAAQLLQESTGPSPNDQRLAQIVHDNVKRANRIIGDVLDLARRDQLKPERLVLGAWLENFRQEFLRGQDWPTPEWRQSVEPAELAVMFDPHQLWQVLWNLCANACQHGSRVGETPQIELRAGLDDGRARPFLDVRDTGAGVAADNVAKLFEPFFTTRTKGTGLGLYLARELCEANRAQLQYRPPPEGGGCFRITFTAAHFVSETN
ncbi:MAG TPA: histidine kinase dimerization/phospho-acceptor domain-containing protein, partial [Candidatus Competibacter sp.]|nr:histidine kinase dimerization/phospho-acceptor domain-containing protein [Candidatus Competibacter sp.]